MAEFRECRFGRVALYIAVIEPVTIWGIAMAFYAMQSEAPIWLVRGLRLLYTLGISGVIFAIVGLNKDSRPRSASLALVLGLVNLVLCVIPIVR